MTTTDDVRPGDAAAYVIEMSDAATPAPWESHITKAGDTLVTAENGTRLVFTVPANADPMEHPTVEDLAIITFCRNVAPALAAEVIELRAREAALVAIANAAQAFRINVVHQFSDSAHQAFGELIGDRMGYYHALVTALLNWDDNNARLARGEDAG